VCCAGCEIFVFDFGFSNTATDDELATIVAKIALDDDKTTIGLGTLFSVWLRRRCFLEI
jgi:hypothetical protein